MDTPNNIAVQIAELRIRVETIAADVARLARRDEVHEQASHAMSEQFREVMGEQGKEFRAALSRQGDEFRKAMEDQGKEFRESMKDFLKKDEWNFWRSLLQWALMGGLGYAVTSMKLPGLGG